MGKSRRGDKELTREQKLLYENKQLKKIIAQLRGQIARANIEPCEELFSEIDGQDQVDTVENVEKTRSSKKQSKPVPKTFNCPNCKEENLEEFRYSKGSETWFYEKCPQCGYRSPGKKEAT